jgi:type IV pilus assembly protein PilW
MQTDDVSQSGLTLVELLISITCLLLILAGVYDVFSRQSETATAEQEILNMQMSSRVAIERLGFVFGNAGFGCRDSFNDGETMSGDDPDGNGSVTVDQVFWDIQNNNVNGTNPDSVVVTYGFRKVAEVDGLHNSTTSVDFKNIGSPSITTSDFKKYLCFFPNIEGDLFYEVDDATDPFGITKETPQLSDDSEVYMVTPVRIKLVDECLYLQNFAYSQTNLWEAVENIQDLQLQYTTDGTSWVDNPADPEDVIGVRIFVLARTERRDPGYSDSKTYELAGQTVGPFNDPYHRKVAQTTVWVRNNDQ